jgi:hypothetical protein
VPREPNGNHIYLYSGSAGMEKVFVSASLNARALECGVERNVMRLAGPLVPQARTDSMWRLTEVLETGKTPPTFQRMLTTTPALAPRSRAAFRPVRLLPRLLQIIQICPAFDIEEHWHTCLPKRHPTRVGTQTRELTAAPTRTTASRSGSRRRFALPRSNANA